jgi:hypothetical protein
VLAKHLPVYAIDPQKARAAGSLRKPSLRCRRVLACLTSKVTPNRIIGPEVAGAAPHDISDCKKPRGTATRLGVVHDFAPTSSGKRA